MKILLVGTLPGTPVQMHWIKSQPADLIIVARDACDEGKPNSPRSCVLRFPVAAGNLERGGGESPNWLYELRHVRLSVNQSGGTSIPVVMLPCPISGCDDDWCAAANRRCVDAGDIREPYVLVTVSAPEESGWPVSEEILILHLSDVVRPAISVFGVTRVIESRQTEQRRVWIDSSAYNGPIPHHAWITWESPTGPIKFRDNWDAPFDPPAVREAFPLASGKASDRSKRT